MSIPIFSGIVNNWNNFKLIRVDVDQHRKCEAVACKPEMEIYQAMGHTDVRFQAGS